MDMIEKFEERKRAAAEELKARFPFCMTSSTNCKLN